MRGIGLEICEISRILRNKTIMYGWWNHWPHVKYLFPFFILSLRHQDDKNRGFHNYGDVQSSTDSSNPIHIIIKMEAPCGINTLSIFFSKSVYHAEELKAFMVKSLPGHLFVSSIYLQGK